MTIDFAALIASRKSGFTLPAPFYLEYHQWTYNPATPARRAA